MIDGQARDVEADQSNDDIVQRRVVVKHHFAIDIPFPDNALSRSRSALSRDRLRCRVFPPRQQVSYKVDAVSVRSPNPGTFRSRCGRSLGACIPATASRVSSALRWSGGSTR